MPKDNAEPARGGRPSRSQFRKGHDPRRYRLSPEKVQDNFWRAHESIVSRYPNALLPDGRHMVCNFLSAVTTRRGAR
jgi:hypothetical protein